MVDREMFEKQVAKLNMHKFRQDYLELKKLIASGNIDQPKTRKSKIVKKKTVRGGSTKRI